jgi:hypothetical protein
MPTTIPVTIAPVGTAVGPGAAKVAVRRGAAQAVSKARMQNASAMSDRCGNFAKIGS